MGTKLFDTYALFNTPGTTNVNLVAKQMHAFDIAAWGPSGNCTATFPAGTEVGECIGIELTTTSLAASVAGAGAANDMVFALNYEQSCALFTWTGALWRLVALNLNAPDDAHAYAQNFTDAEPNPIAVPHGLGANSPAVSVYDDAGNLRLLGVDYTIQRIDSDSLELTLLAVTGTNAWQIGVVSG